MYKICQTESSTKRQRELEKGLLQMLQTRRYEEITVSDLCAHMQIPRKTFYRYFSNKDGAFYALLDHMLADFFEKPVPGKGARGTAIGDLDAFFSFWYENRDFLDALQRSGVSGILVERANTFALREGYLPKQFKAVSSRVQGLALTFAVCGLMSMVLRWHHEGFHLTPEEMTKLAVDLITKPLIGRQ